MTLIIQRTEISAFSPIVNYQDGTWYELRCLLFYLEEGFTAKHRGGMKDRLQVQDFIIFIISLCLDLCKNHDVSKATPGLGKLERILSMQKDNITATTTMLSSVQMSAVQRDQVILISISDA